MAAPTLAVECRSRFVTESKRVASRDGWFIKVCHYPGGHEPAVSGSIFSETSCNTEFSEIKFCCVPQTDQQISCEANFDL